MVYPNAINAARKIKLRKLLPLLRFFIGGALRKAAAGGGPAAVTALFRETGVDV